MITKLYVNSDLKLKPYLESFNLGKNKINYLIDNGLISLKTRVLKSRDEDLKKGDVLFVDTSYYDNNKIEATYYDLEVLYEDDYIVAFNKPSNVLIYDDKTNNNLDNYVQYYFNVNNIDSFPRHIHRLDVETTGVILYAKDIFSHSKLSMQFENRTVQKFYLAKVIGSVTSNGIINSKIGRNRHENGKMIVSKTGDSALTIYKVLENNTESSLLEVEIKTGRTHQIRVHLASINHFVIGDKLYNPYYKKGENLCLHCYKIVFIHPMTGEKIIIQKEKCFSNEK